MSCSARIPSAKGWVRREQSEKGFMLTDNDRSPIQVLGFVEALVFGEGIDRYVRLPPGFEVCQALARRIISKTLTVH